MTLIQRTVAYLLILIIVVALVVYTKPSPYTGMHSVLLRSNVVQPARQSESINVYPFAPLRYRHLGYINIEEYFRGDADKVAAEVKARAKQLAGSVGADALVITFLGTVPNATGPMKSVYIFRGIAIDEH